MDGSLIERARVGDEAAWKVLVGEHLAMIHALCRAFGLGDAAGDAVNQAVWLRLSERLPRIRTPGAVGGWIAATARRECLAAEHDARRSGWTAGTLTPASTGGTGPPPVSRTDEAAVLARAFVRLGAFDQRLLRLGAVRPRPPDEVVAAALDIPPGRVAPAHDRAVRRLAGLVRVDPAGAPAGQVEAALQRTLATGDPVPASRWPAADTALAWLRLEAVPAERVYDATLPLIDHAGRRRNGMGQRSLRFSVDARRVDVVVDVADVDTCPEVVLTGWLEPQWESGVVARWPGGSRAASVDGGGAFRLRGLPVAPLSIQVGGEGVGRTAVKTGWIFP